MSDYKYVKEFYGVPACTGRVIEMQGRRGVIVEDRGHYIGVNFDDQKPGVISNVHPTWEMEYHGIGKVRPMSRSQRRYQRFLEYGDSFETFRDFLAWDSEPERSWNSL